MSFRNHYVSSDNCSENQQNDQQNIGNSLKFPSFCKDKELSQPEKYAGLNSKRKSIHNTLIVDESIADLDEMLLNVTDSNSYSRLLKSPLNVINYVNEATNIHSASGISSSNIPMDTENKTCILDVSFISDSTMDQSRVTTSEQSFLNTTGSSASVSAYSSYKKIFLNDIVPVNITKSSQHEKEKSVLSINLDEKDEFGNGVMDYSNLLSCIDSGEVVLPNGKNAEIFNSENDRDSQNENIITSNDSSLDINTNHFNSTVTDNQEEENKSPFKIPGQKTQANQSAKTSGKALKMRLSGVGIGGLTDI